MERFSDSVRSEIPTWLHLKKHARQTRIRQAVHRVRSPSVPLHDLYNHRFEL